MFCTVVSYIYFIIMTIIIPILYLPCLRYSDYPTNVLLCFRMKFSYDIQDKGFDWNKLYISVHFMILICICDFDKTFHLHAIQFNVE